MPDPFSFSVLFYVKVAVAAGAKASHRVFTRINAKTSFRRLGGIITEILIMIIARSGGLPVGILNPTNTISIRILMSFKEAKIAVIISAFTTHN